MANDAGTHYVAISPTWLDKEKLLLSACIIMTVVVAGSVAHHDTLQNRQVGRDNQNLLRQDRLMMCGFINVTVSPGNISDSVQKICAESQLEDAKAIDR